MKNTVHGLVVLLVSAAVGAEGLAQGPPPTVEQVDEVVADQALVYRFEAPGGDWLQFRLAVLQQLHAIEGLSPQERVAFVRNLEDHHDRPDAAVAPSAIDVDGSLLPVSSQTSTVDRELLPAFARFASEPAHVQVARTARENDGVLEVATLREAYETWKERQVGIPSLRRLRGQQGTATLDRELFLRSPEYRAARAELFGSELPFTPSTPAPAVLAASPTFADFGDDVVALRIAIEEGADAAADDHLQDILRTLQDSTHRLLGAAEESVGLLKASEQRVVAERDARKARAEREKIRQSNAANRSAVMAIPIELPFVLVNMFGSEDVRHQFRQVLTVARTAKGVISQVDRFLKTPDGADLDLARVALTGNIAMLALTGLGELLGGGPSPEAQILEAVQRVHRLLEQVRDQMHARFDQVLDLVVKGYELLAAQNRLTHAMLSVIERQVNEQVRRLWELSRQLDDLVRAVADTKIEVLKKVNDLLMIGCWRDPAFGPPELTRKEFHICLNGYQSQVDDLPVLELGNHEIHIMREQLADAGTLALMQLRRLVGSRNVGILPSTVVSVPRYLGTVLAVREFLQQQADHADALAVDLPDTRLIRDLAQYGAALDAYIDVIVAELQAVQRDGSAPSVFSDLLGEVDAEVEFIRQLITNVEGGVYDGVRDLPVDRVAGTSWLRIIENGNCTDYAVESWFKTFLVQTAVREAVNRNDLRLARAGWGTLTACIQSRFRRSGRKSYITVHLVVDLHTNADLVGCGGRTIRLANETSRRLAVSRWPRPDEWKRLYRKAVDEIRGRRPSPVLPTGCRYRDHPERFDAANQRYVAEQVRSRVQTRVDDAAARLKLTEATLLSWLLTAFDASSLVGVLNDLELPDLRAALAVSEPWRVADEAAAQLERVRQTLGSDSMQEVVRAGPGHFVDLVR